LHISRISSIPRYSPTISTDHGVAVQRISHAALPSTIPDDRG